MNITGYLPNNWYVAYDAVCKAMHIDPDFCLDVLTAMGHEAASLVMKAQQIVKAEFDRQNAVKRSNRLPRANRHASIIIKTRIAPRPSGYRPNPLLD